MLKKIEINKNLAAILTASLLLTGCFLDGDDDDDDDVVEPPVAERPDFNLGILHINDHHSNVEGDDIDLLINDVEIEFDSGGFPRVVTKIEELKASKENALTLHAGDAITGTLFYTLFQGQVDADLMNEVCFDAFALGNHEFDAGDAGLKVFLDYLFAPTCQTPVLAANIVPEVGTPLAPNAVDDYILPYTIKSYGEEQVGIVGIDIANKTQNSSNPDATTMFLDETESAQAAIDELTAMGVNKIVLLTHYQYENDLELAGDLTGVDVIVGGDSHSLLGDTFTDLGLNPVGPYPTEMTNADGEPVCVVQAWEYAQVVGELDVVFDGEGVVKSCSGTPHLMLGAQGDLDAATQAFIDETPELSLVEPDLSAQAVLDQYSGQVETLRQTIIGTAVVDLCLERIPGQGRSSICTAAETLPNGSDISNIVALAFKEQAKADIAIQNAGGVRIDVPAGDISIDTAYTLLPFANTLVNLEMTGAEIIQVLEEAVDFALNPEGSTGAYPYASGLRYDVDLNQAMGSRLSNVEVKIGDATSYTAIDTTATYTVVTNNFISAGRDGYLTFGTLTDEGRVEDTFLDYAQSFVDYVKDVGSVEKLPLEDYSTQNFVPLAATTQ